MKKIARLSGLFVVGVILSTGAQGFSHKNLTRLVGGSGAADTKSLEATQEAMLTSYSEAAGKIAEANEHFALAFGKEEEAAEFHEIAMAYQSGAVRDKKQLKSDMELFQVANEEIEKSLESADALSDESRDEYSKGAVAYLEGAQEVAELADDFGLFLASATNVIANGSITQKMSLNSTFGPGMNVATGAPELVSNMVTMTPKLVDYAESQGIELPMELESLISELYLQ